MRRERNYLRMIRSHHLALVFEWIEPKDNYKSIDIHVEFLEKHA
jgi:hypothetical protein